MKATNGLLASVFAGLMLIVATVSAQTPPPAAPAGGRGAGAPPAQAPQAPRGRGIPPFPAQQRPPADPAVAARGKALYEGNCQSCHAADFRGATGPNLLRSQAVLADKEGELLEPIIHGSLAPRMAAINMSADDVKTLAIYIHDVVRTARTQGAPPREGVPVTNTVVGDAAAGKTYFEAKCTTCHSLTGDLANIGNRMPDGKALQNLWVSGGAVGGGGGRGRGGRGGASDRTPTVTVTLPTGGTVQGTLINIDDFNVIVGLQDGTQRTIGIDSKTKVAVKDPMDAHRALWETLTDKAMHDVTAYLVTVK